MKKQSSTKPQPEPVFFVDRNLGRGIVRLLRDAGFRVEAHDDHFAQNTQDVEWIPVVAKKHWIVLTGDKRIGFNALEIDAHMTAGGRAYLPKGKMRPQAFAELLIVSKARVLRHIKRQRKSGAGPYMAKLAPNPKHPDKPGSIETWIDVTAWKVKIQRRTR